MYAGSSPFTAILGSSWPIGALMFGLPQRWFKAWEATSALGLAVAAGPYS